MSDRLFDRVMISRSSYLAVLIALCLAGGAVAGTVSPVQGVGELPFSADMPVFYDEFGAPQTLLAARVFERDLVAPKSGEPQRLSLRVKLARAGVVAVDTARTIEYTPRPAETGISGSWTEPFRLIEIATPIDPGTWAVTLELTDGSGRSSTASSVLIVPAGTAPRLSDPQYQLGSGTGKIPWPDRVYGLSQDTLEVYFEVESVERLGPQPFLFEIHDPRYGLLAEQRLDLPLEPGLNAAFWRMPVADFPEGSYSLRIVPPWGEEDQRISEFSVSWRIDRALEGGDELLVEARLALLPKDFDYLKRLSRARQIQMLDEFWAVVDPTPGTERNETRDLFRARIEEANRVYRWGIRPGALTDRGQTMVRFGRPQTIDTEVIPRNADDLDLAIRNLHDIYTPEIDGVMARGDIYGDVGNRSEIVPSGQQGGVPVDYSGETALDLKRNAASVLSEGAFEVWKYEYMGRPLLEHLRPGISENQHIRFIFVDRRGVGDYRLEFSNLSTLR